MRSRDDGKEWMEEEEERKRKKRREERPGSQGESGVELPRIAYVAGPMLCTNWNYAFTPTTQPCILFPSMYVRNPGLIIAQHSTKP